MTTFKLDFDQLFGDDYHTPWELPERITTYLRNRRAHSNVSSSSVYPRHQQLLSAHNGKHLIQIFKYYTLTNIY